MVEEPTGTQEENPSSAKPEGGDKPIGKSLNTNRQNVGRVIKPPADGQTFIKVGGGIMALPAKGLKS